MTTQEILASLSSLEQELQSIKSARVLAEDTIQSYKDVQGEIRIFFTKFQEVTASLNAVASAFSNEETSLTSEAEKTIEVLNSQLKALNDLFLNRCNEVILSFSDSVNNSAKDLKLMTSNLTEDYANNNKLFKENLNGLEELRTALIKASASIEALKGNVSTLQTDLKNSQDSQDKTLERIAANLKNANESQIQIINKLSEDLTSSQDTQDTSLQEINSKVTGIKGSLPNLDAKADTAISNISSAKSALEARITSVESQVADVAKTVTNLKTLAIINIVAVIIAIILMFVK
jgi:DNA repair exonuclease SbcCD ATPase subunit